MRARGALLGLAIGCAAGACGSRTGLLLPVEGEPEDSGVDAAEEPDTSLVPDAEPDVIDATVPPPDAPEEDAREERIKDALPPIDVSPPVDASNDCPDAGATLIYVMTQSNQLLSFYPPTATFRSIGTIDCNAGAATPYSMAVDSTGIAYVEFTSGKLFHVSTLTAACVPTSFKADQVPGFATFGMGFSANAPGSGETLFVASAPVGGGVASALGSVDTMSFKLAEVGRIHPTIVQPELTGTGAGDLFAFYEEGSGTAIGQLDKTTAQLIGQTSLAGVPRGDAWAFAFWGGDFYTFTEPGASSVVTRYRPSDGSIVQVAATDQVIVGAGVSTCAPQQ